MARQIATGKHFVLLLMALTPELTVHNIDPIRARCQAAARCDCPSDFALHRIKETRYSFHRVVSVLDPSFYFQVAYAFFLSSTRSRGR